MEATQKGKETRTEHPRYLPHEGSSSQASSDQVTYVHQESNPQHHDHAEHGPPIDNALHNDEAEADYEHHKHLLWSRIRHYMRDPFAEFLGTFIMIIFGDGSVAQVLLSTNPTLDPGNQMKGSYQSISWG